jgi:hypothetical protein
MRPGPRQHSNQRLVCLDGAPAARDAVCTRPLAMIQDVGATFGPTKVNLARWRDLPIWADRERCVVNMRALPYGGSTFGQARISEAGRAQVAERLAALTGNDLAQLFVDARFPQFQAGTDDVRDLDAWVGAFRHRAAQILDTRCE